MAKGMTPTLTYRTIQNGLRSSYQAEECVRREAYLRTWGRGENPIVLPDPRRCTKPNTFTTPKRDLKAMGHGVLYQKEG